jgi:3-hydroxy-9,10-secoandrosta-1,3,5(10)-triene-9,17-dione monooxygenase reductase component
LDPPLLLVCLDNYSVTGEAISRTRMFNVSMLSARQEFFAERFAGRAPVVDPAWREVPHRLGDNGIPIVDGCVGWFECRVHAVHEGGDHDIFVGFVTAAGREQGEPLIYWDRDFWKLGR